MTAPNMKIVYSMLTMLRDPSITNDEKIATVERETSTAERVVIAEILAVEARDRLSDFHDRVGLDSIIMTASLREITSIAAISGLLRPWFRVDIGDHLHRELGQMIKVVPTEVAVEIERWLVWGGLA
jgi:hypothetical protein